MASLKNVQPDAFVTLLVDCQTDKDFLSDLERIKKYVNEYIIVPVEDCVPPIAKSRYIKTSMRKYVKGDFLYIDADTVWNTPVSESDFTHDVMGVLDGHCLLATHPLKKEIEADFKRVNCDPGVERYVNGGVLFSKDSSISRAFFDLWHKKWLQTSETGCFIDMPSLNVAFKEVYGNDVPLLPGVYNCQISRSWKYFVKAKLIHFFTGWMTECGDKAYAFQRKAFWEFVRTNGLDDSVVDMLKNPLSAFAIPIEICDGVDLELRKTATYGLLRDMFERKIYGKRSRFDLVEKIVGKLSAIFDGG
ncbi:hypothetical protein [Fibrobacter sp. UWT2]|uniref:hypothetical protein n=1 Tax=Fibrobacter sp. UWT2 TaxID=1896224 RepID=UPI00093283FD|nr:hypothetical protein [Fibrobacter sp. UWT2]